MNCHSYIFWKKIYLQIYIQFTDVLNVSFWLVCFSLGFYCIFVLSSPQCSFYVLDSICTYFLLFVCCFTCFIYLFCLQLLIYILVVDVLTFKMHSVTAFQSNFHLTQKGCIWLLFFKRNIYTNDMFKFEQCVSNVWLQSSKF